MYIQQNMCRTIMNMYLVIDFTRDKVTKLVLLLFDQVKIKQRIFTVLKHMQFDVSACNSFKFVFLACVQFI